MLWCGAESNRRHKDFQSFALPTELPHRLNVEQGTKNVQLSIFSNWAAKIKQLRYKMETK